MDEMFKRRDEHGLGLLWLLDDPEHCTSLLPRMLQLGSDRLVRRLADQLLSPTLETPFPEALVASLDEGALPEMPGDLADALGARLQDDEPFEMATYEDARPSIARWVIAQRGMAAARLALAVLADETPFSDEESVRESARKKCAESAPTFLEAVKIALAALSDDPSAAAWLEGVALLEAGNTAARSRASMKPLAVALIETAPSCSQTGSLDEVLDGFVLSEALPSTKALVKGGPLPDLLGSRGVIVAALGSPDASVRAKMFQLLLQHQPHLWTCISHDLDEWDAREWKRRLAAAERVTPLPAGVVRSMIDNAPIECVREVMAFAVAQAEDDDEVALAWAGARLDQAIDEEEEDASNVKLVPWDLAKAASTRPLIRAVLDADLAESTQAKLVAEAYLASKLTAAVTALLIPDGRAHEALASIAPGTRRAGLCLALLNEREEETIAAVESLQSTDFSLDLAEASAQVAPSAAFSGSTAAYNGLTDAERNSLTALVERFGTDEQIPLLVTIIQDDAKGTSARRLRATRRVGELVEPRGEIPGAVLQLLGSSNRDLRSAAIAVVEAVRPRNPDVIDQLRHIAASGGVPGQSSTEALDAIAGDILDELGESPSKDASLELLPLLGKTGSPAVLDSLFGFVGDDPRYDDPGVRRVAAAAIADAAEGMKDIAMERQARLVELVEGDEAEIDPQAAASLQLALSRIQLGADDALNLLYDNFLPSGLRPKADPDVLFGAEKETIVSHLDLYAKAKAVGPAGRGRRLAQLDIIAAAMARAAYLHHGDSEPLKAEIRATRKQENYGSLLTAIGNTSKMKAIRAELEVIRNLRSDKSMEAHPGQSPTDDDVISAENAFKTVATRCVQLLDDASK